MSDLKKILADLKENPALLQEFRRLLQPAVTPQNYTIDEVLLNRVQTEFPVRLCGIELPEVLGERVLLKFCLDTSSPRSYPDDIDLELKDQIIEVFANLNIPVTIEVLIPQGSEVKEAIDMSDEVIKERALHKMAMYAFRYGTRRLPF